MASETETIGVGLDDGYRYGFSMPENYFFKSRKGLDEQIVKEISGMKSEPEWMTRFCLRALKLFEAKPVPQWCGRLSDIDYIVIHYYVRASDMRGATWYD